MSQSADYTIKGFLYQFNKTLLEILDSSDESIITAEGVVEDIEIEMPEGITAIQCKYHEASKSFTPSSIYEPLLKMMNTYHNNEDANIRYVLFAHFPTVNGKPHPQIGKTELNDALKSKNKNLQKLIEKLDGVDIEGFLSKFDIEFGPAYDEMVSKVRNKLVENGISKEEIDTLAYPNAVNIMANISVKHDPKERKTTKSELLQELRSIRQTAITRWTLALRSREKLFKARRKQLKVQLDKNSRLRYFILDESNLDDFEDKIVIFISDYLEKYHFKPVHNETPIFCLHTTIENFRCIQQRLFAKKIKSADGYIGTHFEVSEFFRNPMKEGKGINFKREFSIRLLCWEENGRVINNKKCEDLFVIGKLDSDIIDKRDINVEVLEVSSLKEASYLLGVSNVYE